MLASPQIWQIWAKCMCIIEGWTRRIQSQHQQSVRKDFTDTLSIVQWEAAHVVHGCIE